MKINDENKIYLKQYYDPEKNMIIRCTKNFANIIYNVITSDKLIMLLILIALIMYLAIAIIIIRFK